MNETSTFLAEVAAEHSDPAKAERLRTIAELIEAWDQQDILRMYREG